MELDRSVAPRKRRRPPKACEQCRKRKVRCDQNSPCNQCIRLKIEDCSYDPQTLLKRDAKKSKLSVASILGSGAPPTPASTVEQDSSSRQKDISILSAHSSIIHSPTGNKLDERTYADQPYHIIDELLENNPLHVVQHNARRAQPPDDPLFLSHESLHGTITKTRLLGRSHWINIAQEFPFISHMKKVLSSSLENEAKVLLDKCKVLGRSIKNQVQLDFKPLSKLQECVPSKVIADNLVNNYFRVFESCYRILHVPSFRREYDEFWRTPESASSLFIMKLLLVLATGTCLNEDQPVHELHTSALQWISAVQSWLSSPFTEKARVSLSGIQIYCLLLLARETCSVSPDLLWISAGSLLRMAMLSGLHRDPSQFLRLTSFHSEIRRRLWATVLELCLQSSMNAGGSPLITIDMHDCQPPANLDDEDMNEETGTVATGKANSTFTRTSLQIALLQAMPLRLKIAKVLNDFRIDQTFADTLKIDSEYSALLHQTLTRLKSGRDKNTRVVSDTDLKLFELMTYRFVLGLHQTFALKAMSDPTFYFSRKVCVDTALTLASSAFPLKSNPVKDNDFQSIIEAGSGTSKNALMVSFLMLSLELVTLLGTVQSTSSNISDNMLRKEIFRVMEAYSGYTLRRLQKGETNVKGYVFSRVGLGYLGALEEGRNGDADGAAAGINAGRVAIEILQNRLNEFSTSKPSLPEENFGEDFGIPFGDDFGWDDWDPSLNFMSTSFLQP